MPCPHCALTPFAFVSVSSQCSAPRRYTDSPSLHKVRLSGAFEGIVGPVPPSPVRPGDSVEALHRKMLRFGDGQPHSRKPSDSLPPRPVAGMVALPSLPTVLAEPPEASAFVTPRSRAVEEGEEEEEGVSEEEAPTDTKDVDPVAAMFASSALRVHTPLGPPVEPGEEPGGEDGVIFMTPLRSAPLEVTSLDKTVLTEGTLSPMEDGEASLSMEEASMSTLALSAALVTLPPE